MTFCKTLKNKITHLLFALTLVVPLHQAKAMALGFDLPQLFSSLERGLDKAEGPAKKVSTIISTFILVTVATLSVINLVRGRADGIVNTWRDKLKLPPITFDDIIGAERAKAALQDIVQLLKTPERYTRVGAHMPKGILLVGEPGNGKTLLARALAGESGAHFISINGAEFSDRYVGDGILRVRQIFAKARKHAPCVLFIDEIDGIGKRSSSDDPVAQENNRIIAELLTQMDGLVTDPKKPVIVVGATNHKVHVDGALLRSGRLDTIVTVENPGLEARAAILKLYAKKITCDVIDFALLAELTHGLSGADLANLVNQAALHAARRDAQAVQQVDFEQALEQLTPAHLVKGHHV